MSKKQYNAFCEMMDQKQEKLGGLSFMDAIEKQKAIPVDTVLFCGDCNNEIDSTDYEYCPYCGRRILWNL